MVSISNFASFLIIYTSTYSYFRARNLDPGDRGLVGGAQASRGALTVQKARMLHRYL